MQRCLRLEPLSPHALLRAMEAWDAGFVIARWKSELEHSRLARHASCLVLAVES